MDKAAVVEALATVVDPELTSRSPTSASSGRSRSTGRIVEVHLRLPTSFCAPNFAWLMAADARDALAASRAPAGWWSSSTTTTTPT